jgi:hypothetical protein
MAIRLIQLRGEKIIENSIGFSFSGIFQSTAHQSGWQHFTIHVVTLKVGTFKNRVMKKWEYLFLTAEKIDKVWQPRFVDGKELENRDTGTNLYDYTNQLGTKGWELVTVNWQAREDLTHYRFVFKRKKKSVKA